MSDAQPGGGDVAEGGAHQRHAAQRDAHQVRPGLPTSDAIRIGAAEQPVSMSTASLRRLRSVQLECPPTRGAAVVLQERLREAEVVDEQVQRGVARRSAGAPRRPRGAARRGSRGPTVGSRARSADGRPIVDAAAGRRRVAVAAAVPPPPPRRHPAPGSHRASIAGSASGGSWPSAAMIATRSPARVASGRSGSRRATRRCVASSTTVPVESAPQAGAGFFERRVGGPVADDDDLDPIGERHSSSGARSAPACPPMTPASSWAGSTTLSSGRVAAGRWRRLDRLRDRAPLTAMPGPPGDAPSERVATRSTWPRVHAVEQREDERAAR